jgi:hypothetical protein
MLVLIVVVAATAFAAFVQSYQKQAQSEQTFSNEQHLESLHVLSVTPIANVTSHNATWLTLNFTVASEYINPTTITYLTVNSNAVAQYTVWRVDPNSGLLVPSAVDLANPLTLNPREQVGIVITFSLSPTVGSFVNLDYLLSTTSYVQLNLFTALQNDFVGLFIPPTAFAVVSTVSSFSGGGFITVPVLDGSNSFQSGNASLIRWAWNITETAPTPGAPTFTFGEKVVATSLFSATSGTQYLVTLTVTNSDGLSGNSAITYTVP